MSEIEKLQNKIIVSEALRYVLLYTGDQSYVQISVYLSSLRKLQLLPDIVFTVEKALNDKKNWILIDDKETLKSQNFLLVQRQSI